MRPHRRQPTRLLRPWDSPGKNPGVGCHFLLQCMKVKSEGEVAQSCLTLCDPMDYSLPGSSVHGIFQARVLEWGAIAFSELLPTLDIFLHPSQRPDQFSWSLILIISMPPSHAPFLLTALCHGHPNLSETSPESSESTPNHPPRSCPHLSTVNTWNSSLGCPRGILY